MVAKHTTRGNKSHHQPINVPLLGHRLLKIDECTIACLGNYHKFAHNVDYKYLHKYVYFFNSFKHE
jgi:hypothetical protein